LALYYEQYGLSISEDFLRVMSVWWCAAHIDVGVVREGMML